MKRSVRFAMGAGAALGLSAFAAPVVVGAAGIPGGPQRASGADHADDGSLSLANTYDTGGLGGILNGSAVDHTASQGALTYDAQNALLYAVNAGSNTVSVFSVSGDQLTLVQVVNSGGTFPVSVAASGRLVYVLNALDGGSVTGYRVAGGKLHPIDGSTQALNLAIPSDRNQFTSTPGQVAFSPDGSQLIVTTKNSSNSIDVFGVTPSGRLSAPVQNSEPSTVPFAVSFDAAGHLVVAEAGPNALATFNLNPDGTVALIGAVPAGQAGTCWVAPAQGYFYSSNAGSASVSGYQENAVDGQLSLLTPATTTDPGTVDASASSNGQFLYVQTGKNGIVDEFQVNANGSLTGLGSVPVAGAAGGEGIVAF
jgi:6-phosphogluconolactonase (cycloisomerase 2 family)